MKVRTCGVGLILAICGCRMCQDPWDYSGPVQGSPPIPYSATTTRSGSAFNGAGAMPASSAAPNVPKVETKPAAPEESPSIDPVTRRPTDTTIRR